MAESTFQGTKSFVVFAEDTAWGTPGTPAGTDYVDKVTSFTGTITNNMVRHQGIGEGLNATNATYGVLDVSGSIEWELTDPAFLQYAIIGLVTGAGTTASHYVCTEANCFGYTATEVNTLTLQMNSEGTNDHVMTYDGVTINSWSVSATQGETVTCSCDWIGRSVTSSTSALTYTPPANRPFTFVDGTVTIGGDVGYALQSFELTASNDVKVDRAIGTRIMLQPVPGQRRYDFTFTLKARYNDGASILSGLEALGLVMDGTPSGTTPSDTAAPAGLPLTFNLVEGVTSGDRNVLFQFENAYFESASEPIEIGGGNFEITVTGFALRGTGGVPLDWYTET